MINFFTYNAGGERVKMQVTQGTTALSTRYYIGGRYESDTQTGTERLYLGGDAYSAPAVYVKGNGSDWNYSVKLNEQKQNLFCFCHSEE